MAYIRENLGGNIGVGAGVPTLFAYTTADALATVEGAGYFNGSADILEVHDIIQVTGATFGIYRVSVNDGVTVTVVAEDKEA